MGDGLDVTGGGILIVGGIGCLSRAWATVQAARDSALTYQQWAELGDRGRALNAAGLALTGRWRQRGQSGGFWGPRSRPRCDYAAAGRGC